MPFVVVSGYSDAYICRAFRADLGCTPRQAMQLLRAHMARHMLGASTLRARQIARELGYPAETHMARALRAIYGQSPRQLRRRMASGDWSVLPGQANLHSRFGDIAALFWDPTLLKYE